MKVISLINMKGGVGKTTLAVNLSDSLSRKGYRVLTLDLDPQFNATQCLFSEEHYKRIWKEEDTTISVFDGIRVTPGTVDGIRIVGSKPFHEIRPQHIRTGNNVWDALPGTIYLYLLDKLQANGREFRLRNYVDFLGKEDRYDFIIIDTPPTPSIWMTSAIIASNYYLIPTKPDPISWAGLDLLDSIILKEIKSNYNLAIQCAGVVLNMTESNNLTKSVREKLREDKKWGRYLYQNELLKRVDIPRYQMEGGFIRDLGDPKISDGLIGITNELIHNVS